MTRGLTWIHIRVRAFRQKKGGGGGGGGGGGERDEKTDGQTEE